MKNSIKLTDLKLEWINKPKHSKIESSKVSIITDPQTDFWQRTYYGFQNNNAPALLSKIADKYFSFVVKTEFNSKQRYDQCGVIIYQDSDNWFKASIEYENFKDLEVLLQIMVILIGQQQIFLPYISSCIIVLVVVKMIFV